MMPDNLKMLLVLVGMAMLALFVASMISKYESYMAEKRLIVQRLLRGIALLEDIFDKIPAGSMVAGMGKWMRKEVLARYLSIKNVMPRHPDIDGSIKRASHLLEQEPEGMMDPKPPAINDRSKLDLYLLGQKQCLDILHSPDIGGSLPQRQREEYTRFIKLLQAEAAFGYFTVAAKKSADSGQLSTAISEIRMLDNYLHNCNIMTDRVLQIKRETKQLFANYYERQVSERLGYGEANSSQN